MRAFWKIISLLLITFIIISCSQKLGNVPSISQVSLDNRPFSIKDVTYPEEVSYPDYNLTLGKYPYLKSYTGLSSGSIVQISYSESPHKIFASVGSAVLSDYTFNQTGSRNSENITLDNLKSSNGLYDQRYYNNNPYNSPNQYANHFIMNYNKDENGNITGAVVKVKIPVYFISVNYSTGYKIWSYRIYDNGWINYYQQGSYYFSHYFELELPFNTDKDLASSPNQTFTTQLVENANSYWNTKQIHGSCSNYIQGQKNYKYMLSGGTATLTLSGNLLKLSLIDIQSKTGILETNFNKSGENFVIGEGECLAGNTTSVSAGGGTVSGNIQLAVNIPSPLPTPIPTATAVPTATPVPTPLPTAVTTPTPVPTFIPPTVDEKCLSKNEINDLQKKFEQQGKEISQLLNEIDSSSSESLSFQTKKVPECGNDCPPGTKFDDIWRNYEATQEQKAEAAKIEAMIAAVMSGGVTVLAPLGAEYGVAYEVEQILTAIKYAPPQVKAVLFTSAAVTVFLKQYLKFSDDMAKAIANSPELCLAGGDIEKVSQVGQTGGKGFFKDIWDDLTGYFKAVGKGKEVVLKWDNLKSLPTWGHTFLHHGDGKKITSMLTDVARSTKTPQGQWLDNKYASKFLEDLRSSLEYVPGRKELPVPLPPGITGQVIKPNGEIVQATHFIADPDIGGGYVTAFPVVLD